MGQPNYKERRIIFYVVATLIALFVSAFAWIWLLSVSIDANSQFAGLMIGFVEFWVPALFAALFVRINKIFGVVSMILLLLLQTVLVVQYICQVPAREIFESGYGEAQSITCAGIWLCGVAFLAKAVFRKTKNLASADKGSSTKAKEATSSAGQGNFSFLLTVADTFDIQGVGPAATGIIIRGQISSGDTIYIIGDGKILKAKCLKIEHNGQVVNNASVGQDVGLLLSGVRFDQLRKGQQVRK